MIYNVKGTLTYTDPTFAVVDCGGVGFKCYVSMTTLKELPSIGNEVNLYTYMSVREDALDLFGFYDNDELEAFKLLISVSGIGPKAAIAILSELDPDRLAICIASGDAKLISSAKGIGLKTAQKLVVDLKGKFKNVLPSGISTASPAVTGSLETAIMFAQSTGITRAQCMKALSGVEIPADADVDAVIDLIFKNIRL